MPKGIPLTEEEQDRRRHEVFNAAVHLFFEKGFNETSMREIADAAGMGKSTLYDYFKSKDEVLLSVVEDWIYDLTVEAREIAARPLPALERLRQVLGRNLEFLVSQKAFYLKLSFEVQRLGIESQKRIQVQRHAYQDLICRLIEEGIAEGTIRRINPLVAARTLITALSPAVFTSRPSGTPEQMLEEVFDIILRGIQA
jgi:AcrR family transcriptional regulator